MARGNTYTCATCGKTYVFCPKCQIVDIVYDAERFCTQEHADIFAILSKHGCKLSTADETLAELAVYNIDNVRLTDDILAHLEIIKAEAAPVQATAEVVEVKEEIPAQQEDKKNKKKW